MARHLVIDRLLERRNHETWHLDRLFDAHVHISLDSESIRLQIIVLPLHLVESNSYELVLPFLCFDLLTLIIFFLSEIVDV